MFEVGWKKEGVFSAEVIIWLVITVGILYCFLLFDLFFAITSCS